LRIWERITILHKVLGIVSAIILLLGFFGITKYTDVMQRLKSNAVNRIRGKTATAEANVQPSKPDADGLPQNPRADGTVYTVVLEPQDVASHRWELGEPVTRVFRTPRDRTKWVEVAIKKLPHFRGVGLRARDFQDDIEEEEIGAEDLQLGRKIEVQTKAFALTATTRDVRLRTDPDPDKPLSSKVLERLSLEIRVVER
jgi:hypothetical protein